MRKRMRAVRPTGGEVAACDAHLADAMSQVTSPVDGHDNDTHVVVRRLGSESIRPCPFRGHFAPTDARWVLIPQAVLR